MKKSDIETALFAQFDIARFLEKYPFDWFKSNEEVQKTLHDAHIKLVPLIDIQNTTVELYGIKNYGLDGTVSSFQEYWKNEMNSLDDDTIIDVIAFYCHGWDRGKVFYGRQVDQSCNFRSKNGNNVSDFTSTMKQCKHLALLACTNGKHDLVDDPNTSENEDSLANAFINKSGGKIECVIAGDAETYHGPSNKKHMTWGADSGNGYLFFIQGADNSSISLLKNKTAIGENNKVSVQQLLISARDIIKAKK